MSANKNASHPTLMSDLARNDVPVPQVTEFDELPESTDDLLTRAKINKGG